MFTSIVFTAVLASSSALLSQAQVAPNDPGPGDVFNQGSACHFGWAGDTNSTTIWKNMAVELMSGNNEKMQHLTTVATGLDGTTAGTFNYTCPEVTLNQPIYFYQFTSGEAPAPQWTGRWTIAKEDGTWTNATQTEQWDGQTVFFGNGALADPSTAIPPPTFDTTGSSTGSSASAGANSASAGSNSAPSAPSAPAGSSGSTKPSGISGQTSAPVKSGGPSNSASAPQHSGSSAAVAVGPMVLDTRMWPFVAALTACAMAFTILL